MWRNDERENLLESWKDSAVDQFSANAVLFSVERLDFSITFAAIKNTDDKKGYVRGKRTHLYRYEARFAHCRVGAGERIETWKSCNFCDKNWLIVIAECETPWDENVGESSDASPSR